MMSDMVLQLSAISVLSGVILSLMSEGACKKICEILCTAALMNCIASPFISFDFNYYALQAAKLKEVEAGFVLEAENEEKNLFRAVIQEQYEEYILDKAIEYGLDTLEIKIQTHWQENDVCLPYSVELGGSWTESQKQRLMWLIKDELGIPEERQHWNRD